MREGTKLMERDGNRKDVMNWGEGDRGKRQRGGRNRLGNIRKKGRSEKRRKTKGD